MSVGRPSCTHAHVCATQTCQWQQAGTWCAYQVRTYGPWCGVQPTLALVPVASSLAGQQQPPAWPSSTHAELAGGLLATSVPPGRGPMVFSCRSCGLSSLRRERERRRERSHVFVSPLTNVLCHQAVLHFVTQPQQSEAAHKCQIHNTHPLVLHKGRYFSALHTPDSWPKPS